MKGGQLTALADRVETTAGGDSTANEEVAGGLKAGFGEAAAGLAVGAGLLSSTDAALHAVDAAVPGWEISIKGVAHEPEGHWTCTLRETTATDDDAVIGIGRSPSLPCAMIAALLRVGGDEDPRALSPAPTLTAPIEEAFHSEPRTASGCSAMGSRQA